VFTLDLVIPGIPNSAKAMGPMILAAGATQSIRFNFVASVADKFPQINRGEVKMVFIGEVRYTDAFDGPHTTHASGTYDPGRRGFRVEENWGD
jgi:hypothetical protein